MSTDVSSQKIDRHYWAALLLIPTVSLLLAGQWGLFVTFVCLTGFWICNTFFKVLHLKDATRCLDKKLGPTETAGSWPMAPVQGHELFVTLIVKTTTQENGVTILLVPAIRFEIHLAEGPDHQNSTQRDRLDQTQAAANLKLLQALQTIPDNWELSEHGFAVTETLPTKGKLLKHLEELITAAPARFEQTLATLATLDWDQTLAQAHPKIIHTSVQTALLQLYRDFPKNPKLADFIAQHRDRFNQPNQLVANLLLNPTPSTDDYRAMATSTDKLVGQLLIDHCSRRPDAIHLVWGGAFGNAHAATRWLHRFPLENDPLAIPHLIACVHLPFLRREILAKLVDSRDPRVLGLFRMLLVQGEPKEVRIAAGYVAEHGNRDDLEVLHRARQRAGTSKNDLDQAMSKIKHRFPQSENPGALSSATMATTEGRLSKASPNTTLSKPETPPCSP